jgi:hypothetical protein
LASIVERRQRRRAHPRRVIGLAGLFDESVEISIAQKLLETVAKHMARRAWHLRPGHHEVLLDLALTPHRHRRSPSRISVLQTESAGGDFVNTLLKCPAVADRPEEAGDKLFTFTRFPQSQWKSIRTSNAIERMVDFDPAYRCKVAMTARAAAQSQPAPPPVLAPRPTMH